MQTLLKTLLIILFIFTSSNADTGNKWSFYTGTFDFSDEGAKSTLFGVQHINENLYRESFLGTLQPVTGFFITSDKAKYLYSGFQTSYKKDSIAFTPSFTPGLYDKGDGKDLKHVIEFKTEIQISINISEYSELGFSYNHISNANLGNNNPGANSYMINFIKKY